MNKPQFTHFGTIAPLRMHRYERYLPTAFDESLSILQKINKVIQELNRLGDISNDVVERWQQVMDWLLDNGLEDSVKEKLNEWLEDGTLAELINGTLFAELNAKIDSKQNIDSLPFVDVKQLKEREKLTDTQALQKALDVAKTKGGVHVLIPSGMKLILGAELKIYSNTILESQKGVTLTRNHQGYMLMNGFRVTEPNPTQEGGYNAHRNIKVIGGLWDAKGLVYTNQASIFRFSHAQDITIKDVELIDCSKSHHIEFNACKNVRVYDSSFKGVIDAQIFNEAIQLDVAKKSVTNIGLDDGTPCMNVWIENCYFGRGETIGSDNLSRAIGTHTATSGKPQRNINISNCIFDNIKSFTVRAYNWEEVSIENNTFINVGSGINIRSGMIGVGTEDYNGVQVGSKEISKFVISNNIFNGWGGNGRLIEIYGEKGTDGWVKGVTVSGNTIDMSGTGDGYDCIAVVVAQDVSITGNRIKNAKGTGVSVIDSEHISINGNLLFGSGEEGILVSDSLNTIINGNTITKTDRNGIYLSSNDGFNIVGNIIVGVNGATHDDNFNHVRAVTNNKNGNISGNVAKTYSEPYTTEMAIYVTNTSVNVLAKNNITSGLTNSISAVNGTADEHGNIS